MAVIIIPTDTGVQTTLAPATKTATPTSAPLTSMATVLPTLLLATMHMKASIATMPHAISLRIAGHISAIIRLIHVKIYLMDAQTKHKDITVLVQHA